MEGNFVREIPVNDKKLGFRFSLFWMGHLPVYRVNLLYSDIHFRIVRKDNGLLECQKEDRATLPDWLDDKVLQLLYKEINDYNDQRTSTLVFS